MGSIEKRTTKQGKVSYRVKVRLKGFPTQTASFKRRTDAKRWVQQTEAAIREGRHFNISEAKRNTLSQLIERYVKNVLPTKPKIAYDQEKQLQWWSKQIGEKVLTDITPALIAEQRDNLLNSNTAKGTQRAPATVNRYLAVLSHLFTIAVKEWGVIHENPVAKVTKLKEPRGKVRFLTDEEREQLFIACEQSRNPYLKLVVTLCLSTGARKMEIMSLTWDDVDFNRNVIILHETKNGERRLLPLVGKAREMLLSHRKVRNIQSTLLFPSKSNPNKPIGIRDAWQNALKIAGIEDFRFHDLRHSAASYLAMNGATLAEIAEVLGHKTLQMVKRYAHLSEAHTASVVAKMNERFLR